MPLPNLMLCEGGLHNGRTAVLQHDDRTSQLNVLHMQNWNMRFVAVDPKTGEEDFYVLSLGHIRHLLDGRSAQVATCISREEMGHRPRLGKEIGGGIDDAEYRYIYLEPRDLGT